MPTLADTKSPYPETTDTVLCRVDIAYDILLTASCVGPREILTNEDRALLAKAVDSLVLILANNISPA